MATDPPISFRPNPAHRELLADLKREEGMSPSEVVKRGLELMRAVHVPARQPLYARRVDDSDVDAAVEEAVSAACDVLDGLFGQEGSPETRGISSNFQGLLADHIRAMLCGFEHANKTHTTPLNPLLARWDSFGRHVHTKTPQQGVTLMRPAQRVSESDLFYSEGQFVEVQKINVGGLFTSSEAAVKDYLAYLRRRGESPQEHPTRLVVVDFAANDLVVLVS